MRFPISSTLFTAFLLAFVPLPVRAASAIVISQVYGGGGNAGAPYRNDFIELFNRGAAPVDVNGWSVQYSAATGNGWSVTPLPALTMQPGQYLLVQQAAGTGNGLALPAPDAAGTMMLAATAGKVVLASTSAAVSSAGAANVLDLVAFGANAVPFKGTGPAVAASNTKAIQRADDGCSDSQNNSADFAAAVPFPRNGSTPFHPCTASSAPIAALCPDRYATPAGAVGSTLVYASDADGIVNAASIIAGATPGISLSATGSMPTVGASMAFMLAVADTVPAGSYPLTVGFANDQGQAGQCAIAVDVLMAATPFHSIPQIQGSGAASPYVNTIQTTEGVVTLVVSNGYYLQDPAGDGDPASSDGIFVFSGAARPVKVGDRVRLTATVAEFNAGDIDRTVTRLTGVSRLTVLSHGNRIAPAEIALPLASVDDFERYEGMLVRFTGPLTVSQNAFLGRYGQVTLSSGRLEKPTNRYPPRSLQAVAAAAANAGNRIVLDDGRSLQNPVPVPYLGNDRTLRAGDTATDLVGVIDFGPTTASNTGPAAYKLQPAAAPLFSRDNPRLAAPSLPIGNVKVASFNVLNFFTTFADGTTASGESGQGCSLGMSTARSNCRGADNLASFQRQRAKLVAAIAAIDADVLGLMEMQNNGDTAVSNLVEALNAVMGSGVYAVVPHPASTGNDAIRVAMIYKPSRLSLVDAALSDPHPLNSRPPMAQTFAARNGQRFSLIVNHLKSKSSCPTTGHPDADMGDGQGCWNATRVQQANRLASVFIPQVQAMSDSPNVLVIGDMNAYAMEDPVGVLTSAGLVNQVERFLRRGGVPYSYVFDGESGYIDHAFTSAALSSQVLGVAEWHINADEPAVLDYRSGTGPQNLYAPSPYRSSDHDPLVISLDLREVPARSDGSVRP